jgi:hypothetical protein
MHRPPPAPGLRRPPANATGEDESWDGVSPIVRKAFAALHSALEAQSYTMQALQAEVHQLRFLGNNDVDDVVQPSGGDGGGGGGGGGGDAWMAAR